MGTVAPSAAAGNNDAVSHVAGVSTSDKQGEYGLILKKGRGSKRAFNGKEARLAGRRRRANKGGWITVEVKESGKQLKWRNHAWKQQEPQAKDKAAVTFCELTDDCLAHIFSFLATGDHAAPTTDEELSMDFTDEYLAKDLSPEYVDIKLSLKDAVELHKTIALLSKRFDKLCCARLPSILGYLDADFIADTWWHYVPWITTRGLRLKSLKIRAPRIDDASVLLYILEKCDTSKLTTLVALFDPNSAYSVALPMVELAWQEKRLTRNNVFDLERPHVTTTLENAADDLGLPGLSLHRVENRRMIHEQIARRCKVLSSLKIVHLLTPDAEADVSTDLLFQSRTIRQLHLVLTNSGHQEGHPVKCVSRLVSMLTNLKVLKLTGRFRSDKESRVRRRLFQFSSDSLQSIDVTYSGKINWINKCVCPSLRRIVCLYSPHGNGVRPQKAESERELNGWAEGGEYLVGETPFDGTLRDYDGEVLYTSDGLDVPDSCIVVLK